MQVGEKKGTKMNKSWPKMKVDNRGWRMIGDVAQVRKTIGEHGFLEQGQRIMGYGTRHKRHIRSKQMGCGLGSRGGENRSSRRVTWPESHGTHSRENTAACTHARTQLFVLTNKETHK